MEHRHAAIHRWGEAPVATGQRPFNVVQHAQLSAMDINRRSYRKMLQNIALAFAFNGIGIPLGEVGAGAND